MRGCIGYRPSGLPTLRPTKFKASFRSPFYLDSDWKFQSLQKLPCASVQNQLLQTGRKSYFAPSVRAGGSLNPRPFQTPPPSFSVQTRALAAPHPVDSLGSSSSKHRRILELIKTCRKTLLFVFKEHLCVTPNDKLTGTVS